jgi:nicotinate dehydrogenase subunit B
MRETDYTESAGLPASPGTLNRRHFMKQMGGGIVVACSIVNTHDATGQRRDPSQAPDFTAYIKIDEDGRVTCYTGKAELGQGITTSLAQITAEELDAPLDAVTVIAGDTDLCPYDAGTWGSQSIRGYAPALRAAAAEARAVLLELAAEKLSAPKASLTIKDGHILAANNGKQVNFGQLAQGQNIARELDVKPTPKNVADYTVVSRDAVRVDTDKVTGKGNYAGDIRVPGMLYAQVIRPPAYGAKLKSLDSSQAEDMDGVQVIQQDELIVVLHTHPGTVARARELVRADWDIPDSKLNDRNIYNHLISVSPGADREETGNLAQGERMADQIIEHRYEHAYGAHAPIETHTALADVKADKTTIWASTQAPYMMQKQAAELLGVPEEKVRVITPYVGGGFGGKSSTGGQVMQAVRLSKLISKPVQVMWSREDEFYNDAMRPAAVMTVKSGIDKQGAITLWDYAVYYAGARGSDMYYNIPNHGRTLHGGRSWRGGPGVHLFPVAAWRAPGANTNTFARESHIDVMAAAAKMDPLEFRLRNCTDERMRGVLQAAAKDFGWKPAAAPTKRGVGIACGIDAGTYVASCVEIDVDRNIGRVQVKRVVCAQDMGVVINPDGAKMQMEGCITMGLGYTLSEDIHFDGGKLLDLNFDSYLLPRFSDLPEIETILVKNDNLPAQGGGEPAIINMGALVANAIFDATGVRLFHLPMTPDRVKAALQE